MSVLGVGPMEMLVVMVIAMLVLGPARMVSSARVLGKMMRQFRQSTADLPGMVEGLLGEEGAPRSETQDGELPPPSGAQPRRRARASSQRTPTKAPQDPEAGE